MENFIRFFLQNSTVSFFLLGMLIATWKLRRPGRGRAEPTIWHAYFAQYLFWSVGVSYLYNCILHTAFGEMTARFIGWADSPFQVEVGFASLGFALVGFLAFLRSSRDLRFAAVIGPSCFSLGAAGVHVIDMMRSENFAPGNAGSIFYMDILVPVVGFFLLWKTRPRAQ